ncbi:MAG TPA: hypothetical protein DEP46_08580 [Blastocatellia bacterium]|mgnify:FL=1|nr:hypothetical protein [Blastocatellia bacterium]
MYLVRETVLLFGLNLLDALLTLIWVRNGVAEEGNRLMAELLNISDVAFLSGKLAMGLFTAIVLLKWGYYRIAKVGVAIALVLYVGLMGIHLLTGLNAAGIVSNGIVSGTFAAFKPLIAVLFG